MTKNQLFKLALILGCTVNGLLGCSSRQVKDEAEWNKSAEENETDVSQVEDDMETEEEAVSSPEAEEKAAAPANSKIKLKPPVPVTTPEGAAAAASDLPKLKNGMFSMKQDCPMTTEPGGGTAAGKASKGTKLWVEHHDSKWAKIYKKSGPAYISRDCL